MRNLEIRMVSRDAADEFQHYRLNFNACGGRLDVACVSFAVRGSKAITIACNGAGGRVGFWKSSRLVRRPADA